MDEWLSVNASCPTCRKAIFESDSDTPPNSTRSSDVLNPLTSNTNNTNNNNNTSTIESGLLINMNNSSNTNSSSNNTNNSSSQLGINNLRTMPIRTTTSTPSSNNPLIPTSLSHEYTNVENNSNH